MINRITEITEQVNAFVFSKDNNAESFRLFFLSRKGIITQLFDDFKGIPNDEKKAVGARLNQLKQRAEEKYQLQKETEVNQSVDHKTRQDTTLPVYQETPGSFHPLRIVEDRLLDIFFSLGFDLAEGPEIEDDKHNFASLNFAEDHPARPRLQRLSLPRPRNRLGRGRVRSRPSQRRDPVPVCGPVRAIQNDRDDCRGIRQCLGFRRAVLALVDGAQTDRRWRRAGDCGAGRRREDDRGLCDRMRWRALDGAQARRH